MKPEPKSKNPPLSPTSFDVARTYGSGGGVLKGNDGGVGWMVVVGGRWGGWLWEEKVCCVYIY
ncbi:hypothetical protein Hanom_Chr16g01515781 [Helianthus anomalus]